MGAGDRGDASDLPSRFWAAASPASRSRNTTTRRIRSARKSSRCSTRCPRPGCTGLANPRAASLACCSQRRIRSGPRWRVVQHAIAHSGSNQTHLRAGSRRRRGSDVGTWNRCVVPPDPWLRLDLKHANGALQDWVVREMDRTQPAVAAAMHHCFEGVDTIDILPGIHAPVLLLSGDKSQISSD
jgi:hypothetical protein